MMMITTHPSIMLGSYRWDEERLPRDEFDIRMRGLREVLRAQGWSAALIYGDARSHAALAWHTNYIPRMRWGLALVPAVGEPRLLVSMSSRDLPAMRTMTWIGDIRSGWEWSWFDEWVAASAGGTIGTVGFEDMTPQLYESILSSLGSKGRLVEADAHLDPRRAPQRPRELALIRLGARIAAEAAAEFIRTFEASADVENAALAAERKARGSAVLDVRTLVSRDDGRTLEPYRAKFDDRPSRLLGYVAVKHQGYWSEAFANSPGPALDKARRALDRLLAEVRAGASLADIAAIGAAATEGAELHPALSGAFGNRIGLSLDEGSAICSKSEGKLEPGVVYAIRAGVWRDGEGGAVDSAMVALKADGRSEILLRAP